MLICKLKAYYHPDSFACWYTRCWWIVSVLGYKMSGYWKLECKLTSLNSLSLHDGKQILRCPIMASLHRINLTFLNLAWCLSIFPLKLLLCIVKTAAFYGLTSVFKRFQIFLGSHFPCFSSVYRQCMASSEWWRACSHDGELQGQKLVQTRGEGVAQPRGPQVSRAWRRLQNTFSLKMTEQWNPQKDSDPQHQETRSPDCVVAISVWERLLLPRLISCHTMSLNLLMCMNKLTVDIYVEKQITHMKILLSYIKLSI